MRVAPDDNSPEVRPTLWRGPEPFQEWRRENWSKGVCGQDVGALCQLRGVAYSCAMEHGKGQGGEVPKAPMLCSASPFAFVEKQRQGVSCVAWRPAPPLAGLLSP